MAFAPVLPVIAAFVVFTFGYVALIPGLDSGSVTAIGGRS
jgi:hypothetical protein